MTSREQAPAAASTKARRMTEGPTLAECVAWLRMHLDFTADMPNGPLPYSNREIKEAILRSLLSPPPTPPHEGSEAGRWVPWKPGDALPLIGTYHVTTKRVAAHEPRFAHVYALSPTSNRNPRDDWEWIDVIAYWSAPLPPPYQPDVAGGAS
jgi:hypothetical protein